MSENKSEKQPESNWEYSTEPGESTEIPSTNNEQVSSVSTEPDVTWTASEYIAHEKGLGWYLVAGASIIGFALLIFLLDGDRGWFSPAIIIIMGVTFVIAATRKPKVLDYAIDSIGLHAGQKTYRFVEFKSFSVVQEGAIETIVLIPLKRFMPGMTIYFEPKDQDKIINALTAYLPYETRKLDVVDNLMRKIRF